MNMKPTIILVDRHGRPSMKKVYAQMQSNSSLFVRRNLPQGCYYRHYGLHNIDKFTKVYTNDKITMDNRILIRWGNRIDVKTNEHTVTYNKAEAIKKSTDKKLSRQIFIENGVNTPRLLNPLKPVLPKDYEQAVTYPIIARPSVHAKGKNFVVLNNFQEFCNHYINNEANGWYYSEFIDKDREFRVHCAHGKVLDLMEKPRGKGIAWNRAQVGEPFVRVKQEDYIHSVCLEALKATKALGLDFAGVDVILKGDTAYILESNTSPTLNSSEHVSTQYAKYFDWLARSDKRREHWDFTKWKKADSFAWKQEQLKQ
jgi:glutathione synthase/RimK-type ligase-like ATP-grasp enzyme